MTPAPTVGCIIGHKPWAYSIWIFYNGQQACLPFVPVWDTLLNWIVNKPALCSKGRYYIFQGCLISRHPWKDSLEQRESVPLLARYAETWYMHRELSPVVTSIVTTAHPKHSTSFPHRPPHCLCLSLLSVWDQPCLKVSRIRGVHEWDQELGKIGEDLGTQDCLT